MPSRGLGDPPHILPSGYGYGHGHGYHSNRVYGILLWRGVVREYWYVLVGIVCPATLKMGRRKEIKNKRELLVRKGGWPMLLGPLRYLGPPRSALHILLFWSGDPCSRRYWYRSSLHKRSADTPHKLRQRRVLYIKRIYLVLAQLIPLSFVIALGHLLYCVACP